MGNLCKGASSQKAANTGSPSFFRIFLPFLTKKKRKKSQYVHLSIPLRLKSKLVSHITGAPAESLRINLGAMDLTLERRLCPWNTNLPKPRKYICVNAKELQTLLCVTALTPTQILIGELNNSIITHLIY